MGHCRNSPSNLNTFQTSLCLLSIKTSILSMYRLVTATPLSPVQIPLPNAKFNHSFSYLASPLGSSREASNSLLPNEARGFHHKAAMPPEFLISVNRTAFYPLTQVGQVGSNLLPTSLISLLQFNTVQFSSVTQSCPTLCDPMNCSTPGLPVHPSRGVRPLQEGNEWTPLSS